MTARRRPFRRRHTSTRSGFRLRRRRRARATGMSSPSAGEGGDLAFTVSRDGRARRRRRALPRRRRTPRRAARGRPGYLHTHPERRARRPGTIPFGVEYPSRGPLPALPPVPARRRCPHRRLHREVDAMSPVAERLDLPVEGMTCASCANRVERHAERARRRRGGGQLRHRAGGASTSTRPTRPTDRRRGRGRGLHGELACRGRCGRPRTRRGRRARRAAPAPRSSPPRCRCRSF